MNDHTISASAQTKQMALQHASVKVAVIIPCHRVTRYIEEVIAKIGNEVQHIYVIDDCCPEGSGKHVENHVNDARVKVIHHTQNLGVGGAVMSGYQAALQDGAEIMVKVDGDGQIDPSLIPGLISPIVDGDADYTKGNRFFDLSSVAQMPKIRVFGNIMLSFMSKLSTGYWDIFDPTNGFTAIHANVLARLPMKSISKGYFFETDMLFRLNTLRAVVIDVPMDAKYAGEISGLNIRRIIFEFTFKHLRNLFKRIGYNYFLRDMSVASIELAAASIALPFGLMFGAYHWYHSSLQGISTPVGTIMIATVSTVFGLQLALAFLSYDIANLPKRPISQFLSSKRLQ
jgi:dolichol-phosphate mannosyltransferase